MLMYMDGYGRKDDRLKSKVLSDDLAGTQQAEVGVTSTFMPAGRGCKQLKLRF
jgi:hypothetical protein